MSIVEWCKDCGRAKGIGCNCGVPFGERVKSQQVDRFGLLDRDRKMSHPQNKGMGRKLK